MELDTLDYEHYLPLFLDGLCETQHPHEFLARKGAEDLITRAPDRITPLLPVIIPPLRRMAISKSDNTRFCRNYFLYLSVHEKTGALNTRNPRVICSTLKIIQLIATCSKESGRAFLPYYKSLLPILNLFKSINRKIRNLNDYLVLVDGLVFVNSQSGRRNRLLAAEELQSGRFDPGDAGNVGEKWRICRLRPHQEYDPYLWILRLEMITSSPGRPARNSKSIYMYWQTNEKCKPRSPLS